MVLDAPSVVPTLPSRLTVEYMGAERLHVCYALMHLW